MQGLALTDHDIERFAKVFKEGLRNTFLPRDLHAQRPKVYYPVTFDLSTARSNEKYDFVGSYVYAIAASAVGANIDVKFNESQNDVINFVKGREVTTPFKRIYLTNTAQAGVTITLIFGVVDADFKVEDHVGFLSDVDVVRIGGTAQTGFDLYDSQKLFNGTTGTRVNKHSSAVNTTSIIHTVTPGTNFHLAAWTYHCFGTVAGNNANLFIRDGSDVLDYYIVLGYSFIGSQCCASGLTSPIVIPANYDICLLSSAATATVSASIFGWEE